MTTPTPRDELVAAMAESIIADLADEAQWNDAVSYALEVAVRHHRAALLDLCGVDAS